MKPEEKEKYEAYLKLMEEHKLSARPREEWLRDYRKQQKGIKDAARAAAKGGEHD